VSETDSSTRLQANKKKHVKVYSDKFHVILYFTKPNDQSDGLIDYSMQVRGSML
jgi:hypothetical protein